MSLVGFILPSKPHQGKARFHQLSTRVVHEVESSEEDASLTGVWDARKHLQDHFKRVSLNASKGTKTIRVLPDSEVRDANFAAFQLAGPLAGLRIDAHVAFGGADLGARGVESLQLAELAKRSSEAFKAQVAEVFFDGSSSEKAGAAFDGVAVALSSLLGGLGSFRGRLLARTGEGAKPVRLASSVLFSGVPSRSFFPRGFLWDEGFHGLLLARWQPRIFLEVLGHWLELQQENGWIPREVPLGAEQERRVPKQFLTQDSKVANPPSFLLPLSWLLSLGLKEDEKLARQAGLSGKELRDLVLSFSAQALPRLGAWFAFLEKSQKSSNPKCFRWQGRTAAHCLASGLDDYPRGLLVNEDECHLDLQSWMALFARTLARLCKHLAEKKEALSQEANSAWCLLPRWSERAATLNASLFEAFVDPKASKSAPLADFLGLQPVERSGKVRVLPPWRSDGRCGPAIPGGRVSRGVRPLWWRALLLTFWLVRRITRLLRVSWLQALPEARRAKFHADGHGEGLLATSGLRVAVPPPFGTPALRPPKGRKAAEGFGTKGGALESLRRQVALPQGPPEPSGRGLLAREDLGELELPEPLRTSEVLSDTRGQGGLRLPEEGLRDGCLESFAGARLLDGELRPRHRQGHRGRTLCRLDCFGGPGTGRPALLGPRFTAGRLAQRRPLRQAACAGCPCYEKGVAGF